MGFLTSVLESRMDTGPSSTLAEPQRSLLESLGIRPSLAGVSVTEARAEGLPAVYGCVDVRSSIAAWLPLKLMRDSEGGGREPDLNHELYTILHDLPNHLMTAFDFRAVMGRWLLLWGTAYAEIQRDRAGRIIGLWPLRTDRMEKPKTDAFNRLVWTYRLDDGTPHPYVWDPQRPPLMRLMINSLDGITGRSPIRVVMDSMGASLASRDFGAAFYANKANIGGILSFKTPPKDPTEREKNRTEWNKAHAGTSNAGKTAVLMGEVDYKPIGIPPNEAQFIETMQFQRTDIRGYIYRVPGFLVGDTEKSTSWGTGIEQQMRGFLNITMMPDLTAWSQAIARDLLTAKSFNTHKAIFLTDALVQADLLQRVQAQKVQIEMGKLNPNEVRALDDMGPRLLPDGSKDPEGDAYWRPVNMASTAEPAPDPAPAPTPDPTTSEGDDNAN
jgi:HK97 family phage portal protein